jgi:hypothetical protein
LSAAHDSGFRTARSDLEKLNIQNDLQNAHELEAFLLGKPSERALVCRGEKGGVRKAYS